MRQIGVMSCFNNMLNFVFFFFYSMNKSGKMLATSSGDSTVKVWNFEKQKCVHTFSDHLQGVWSVGWHSCGNFLVSASNDKTAKVWDLNSLRCRYTLRGHADSVNSAEFLNFSNTILTSSADKTLSLWDGRTVTMI